MTSIADGGGQAWREAGRANANRPAQQGVPIGFTLEPIAELGVVESLWRSLERAGDTPFFLSWTWIGTWLRSLPANVRPLLLTASSRDETIAAAILVERNERRRLFMNVKQLHFNSTGNPELDCVAIEHNGFVGLSGKQVWAAFLGWFDTEADAGELVVPGVASGVIPWSESALLHDVVEKPAFAAPLGAGGIDGILSGLSANARQQLRRNLRSTGEFGELCCSPARSADSALDAFEALKRLHIRSWEVRGKHHAFRYPFFEEFHRRLIPAGLSDGSVRLLRISAGTHTLGYLYNFCRGPREYAYQSGFAVEMSRTRPGYVSHVAAMERCAQAGVSEYDFLAGDNRLKRTLGQKVSSMAWHRFSRPSLAMRLEAAARIAYRASWRTRK